MKKGFRKVLKISKISAIVSLIAVFGFSNFISFLPQVWQNNELAESLKVKEARAATIEFVGRATASVTSSAYNLSLTALTGGIASAPAEGDIVIVINTIVNTTNGNPGVGTAGYTEVADLYRSDSNDTNLSTNYKIMGASPDTVIYTQKSENDSSVICQINIVNL